MNHVCVYSYYRKHQVNYEWCIKALGKASILYLKTIKLIRYAMYDNAYFPEVTFTGNGEDGIIVDVMLVDNAAYNKIKQDAEGEGLIEDIVIVDDKPCSIFLKPWIDTTNKREVDSGNWINYLISINE